MNKKNGNALFHLKCCPLLLQPIFEIKAVLNFGASDPCGGSPFSDDSDIDKMPSAQGNL